jgi:membrane protease YdiL (CAAX protease family)
VFQFSFTTVFGMFSTCLFLKRGASLFTLFLVHSLCNFFGFPDFEGVFTDFDAGFCVLICVSYVTGAREILIEEANVQVFQNNSFPHFK